MSKCKFPWLVLFLSALIFVSGCTEQGGNTTPTPTGTSIRFKDIQAFLQKPSQVQFSFRVSDNLNHAIVVNPASLPTPFRIFEDNQEIDYTETSYFVHPATSLELDMVILLDLTNSMAT